MFHLSKKVQPLFYPTPLESADCWGGCNQVGLLFLLVFLIFCFDLTVGLPLSLTLPVTFDVKMMDSAHHPVLPDHLASPGVGVGGDVEDISFSLQTFLHCSPSEGFLPQKVLKRKHFTPVFLAAPPNSVHLLVFCLC